MGNKIWRRWPSLLLAIGSLVLIIVFQNCSKSFQASDSASLSSVTLTSTSDLVDLIQVHIGEDLWQRSCDIWNPTSLACHWASYNYCLSQGYAGGYGPVTTSSATAEGYSIASVVCLSSAAADYHEFAYAGDCTSDNPLSIACASEARHTCLGQGYAGASGVIGANANNIATMCLKSTVTANAAVSFSSLAEIQAADPADTTCTASAVTDSSGCQMAAQQYCLQKGYGAGFGVAEYDAATQNGDVICAQAQSVQKQVQTDPQTGRWGRPVVLGTHVMGGPILANGTSTYPDVIFNAFSYPVLVTSAQPGLFQGLVSNLTSAGDSCFDMSGATVNGFDTSFGSSGLTFAELMCSYPSTASTIPAMNYGDFNRGVILNPGESLIYQGTRTSSATGYYNFSTVTFSAVGASTPMMRVRFPRNDQSWIGTPGMLTVPAGCDDATCAVQPNHTISPFTNVASNSWYQATQATSIQGITVYGTTNMSFTIRIVQQGGSPLVAPTTINLAEVSTFASGQSSFIPLNINVPAGALVGIDFTLPVNAGPGDDFAGYLWFSVQ